MKTRQNPIQAMLWTIVACVLSGASLLSADEATAKISKENLVEPVFRVTKQDSIKRTSPAPVKAPISVAEADLVASAAKSHPLDGPLTLAKDALTLCESEIADYTAIIVKRERIDGRLNDECYMAAKIRHEKLNDRKQVEIPFSVYLKFLKPSGVKGREVIYVKGRNKGKLIAHEGGFKGKFTPSLYLDPLGTLAMMGQRYPITDIGIQNLCSKLIVRGNHDRQMGPCVVTTSEANINKRPASRIELLHPKRKPGLDFHIARIFVDNEYRIPIRYEAYDWPVGGGNVTIDDLIEEYTYIRVKFNVGLTDSDFDPDNPKYNM